MKPKYRFIQFYNETYKSLFMFFIGKPEDFEKYMKKKNVKLETVPGKYIAGRCYHIESIGSLIYLREFNKSGPYYIGIMVHEVIHACVNVMEERKISLNSEAFNYLVEMVVRKFLILFK